VPENLALSSTYADVFEVLPYDDSWRWGNGVSEIVGFLPDSEMRRIFGPDNGWGDTVGAVTFRAAHGIYVVEADIILNPAAGFVMDPDDATRRYSGQTSTRQ